MRPEAAMDAGAPGTDVNANGLMPASTADGSAEREERMERGEREGRRERGERGGRGRGRGERGDRGERSEREGSSAEDSAAMQSAAADGNAPVAERAVPDITSAPMESAGADAQRADASLGSDAAEREAQGEVQEQAQGGEERGERRERRERRSGDRYGRDRRERGGNRDERDEREPQAQPAVAGSAAAAPAVAAMPRVQPFSLPVDQLASVAQASGLQWVNSDADKVAAVQAQIAAEPKSIHVPRERPPAVVLDEGPLVLVETRRDLRDLKLPFEQGQPSA